MPAQQPSASCRRTIHSMHLALAVSRYGFQGDFEPTDEGFKCPECGNCDPDKCNVTKRTCGYLGSPVQRPMVHGRHEEIAHRVKHMSGETGRVTLDDGTTREWFEETK